MGGQPGIGFAPLSGFFRTRDGWVRTHANYPHHERALRRALDLLDAPQDGDDPDRVGARLRACPPGRPSRSSRGSGLCVEVRRGSRRTSGSRVAAGHRAPHGGQPARAMVADASAPLRGVRVLDLTRVIAGPVATRTLALLGADVLRVDSPRIPEIAVQHLDTGHGKRSTLLDLDADADRRRFDGLLATADIVVLGYRPAALSRLGLEPVRCARGIPA
jgi:crotonobetainyl-CoA:carnitine CoA-transferase CaiB-like acyl-CoA transferase